ncbi:MAG: hypothetical protein WBP93_12410 [Pyrinomonadaceae bacterium]
MKTILGRLPIITLIMTVGLVMLANAQEALNRPFQQWTKDDAEKILNSSPWARMQEVRIKYAGQTRPVAGGPQPGIGVGGSPAYERTDQNTINSAGAEAPVDFQFTLRLRSALAVREALVRLKQIEAKYDKMSDGDKAAFDAKMKGLLDCPACVDNYVVTLSSKSKNKPGADAVFTLFGGAKEDDIKRYIYLANERGERRSLVHFAPPRAPGAEATFFFARLDDKGTPLFTPGTKELIINLTDNEVNTITNFKVDVTKLIVNGKIDF